LYNFVADLLGLLEMWAGDEVFEDSAKRNLLFGVQDGIYDFFWGSS
jgi:hypothetical protein